MRSIVLASILILLAPSVVFAEATGSAGHVDAGTSAIAAPGHPLPLVAHLEDFTGPVSITWTGPVACVIAEPSQQSTTASCGVGLHEFLVTATQGASAATDTVRHIVGGDSGETDLLQVAGVVAAGADQGLSQGVIVGADTEHESLHFFVEVPVGTTALVADLTWNDPLHQFELEVYRGTAHRSMIASGGKANVLVDAPTPGRWTVDVRPRTAVAAEWQLDVRARASIDAVLPRLQLPSAVGTPGGAADVLALVSGTAGAYSIAWEADIGSRRFDDGAGTTTTLPFAGRSTVLAKLTTSNGLEVVAPLTIRERGELARPVTVVAVVDDSFSPYHADFLGSEHPWNRDADASNDIDFTIHPGVYVAAYPSAAPLFLTLPSTLGVDVNALRVADGGAWDKMPDSRGDPRPMWIPGTKVIGALRFGQTFQGTNGAHGTASASVAAGNIHGTCPTCLFVLIAGMTPEALAWAASQPWIDVVTNSYGHSTTLVVRDNIYLHSAVEATRMGSEDGSVIVFSAGNGLANAFDVPAFTYWSSEKGPDWMVTVGAVSPSTKQTYSGAGKPVDISSIGSSYPSAGGSTASGSGFHSGTSNAAPTTAGTIANVLQRAREALGDTTPGHAGGIVASGAPVACGAAQPQCALGDGILTRAELVDLVFKNVRPMGEGAISIGTVWPTTSLSYYYQGHGVVRGRIDGAAVYAAESQRFLDAATGQVAPYDRPAGETNWFVVDSKCRQRVWGEWDGGYYTGVEPALDPAEDPIAIAFDAWCSGVPAGIGPQLAAATTV